MAALAFGRDPRGQRLGCRAVGGAARLTLVASIPTVIATFLIQQPGLQRAEAKTYAVTLIQGFSSVAHKILGRDFEQP